VHKDKNTDTYNPLELWKLLIDGHMGKFGSVISGTSSSTDIQTSERFVETDTEQSVHFLIRSNDGVSSDLIITRKYVDSDNDDTLIEKTAGIFQIRNKNMLYTFGFMGVDAQFHQHPNVAIAYAIRSRYVSRSGDPSADKLTYFGGYSDRGKCQGYGVTNYLELGKYSGQWDSDNKSGFGTMVYKNGLEIYVGEWRLNVRWGEGMFDSWYDGYKYEGSWIEGEMGGPGVVEWRNGETLAGCFRGHLTIQRDGVLTLQNGDVYRGQFIRGYMLYNVSVKYNNGDVFEGNFDNGDDDDDFRSTFSMINCTLCSSAEYNEYCSCVAPSGCWFRKVKFMVGTFTAVGKEPTDVKWDTAVRKIDNGR
jgi:hypothetical protein